MTDKNQMSYSYAKYVKHMSTYYYEQYSECIKQNHMVDKRNISQCNNLYKEFVKYDTIYKTDYDECFTQNIYGLDKSDKNDYNSGKN